MRSDLLLRLRAAGAQVVQRGERIILRGASHVSPDLLAEARARRGELLAALANDKGASVDPVERAAIQAEAVPVLRLRKRHVSWSNAGDEPAPGDYCGCCSGQLFWCDTDPPRGWRCCRCHRPCLLEAGQFRVVAT